LQKTLKTAQKILTYTFIVAFIFFWTMLPLDVWDSLVAEDWHFVIWSGSCPDLKGDDYDLRH
jgi:hypothetical protein